MRRFEVGRGGGERGVGGEGRVQRRRRSSTERRSPAGEESMEGRRG